MVESVAMEDGSGPISLKIRRYQPRDQAAVWELHNLALHQVGAHPGNGPWDADLHAIETIYLDAGGEFLVGERAGQLVAMGALKRRSDELAEITRMRVHPNFQRRGFGRAILERLEDRARKLGYRELYLETTVQQVGAQALYRATGYQETHRFEFGPFTCISFAKRVVVRRDNSP